MIKPLPLSDPTRLRSEFDRCWDWLWASLNKFGPTHSKEQVWDRIICGRAFLWAGEHCVIVGEFIDHPIGARSFNYWLQGGAKGQALEALALMWDGVEAWALANGCSAALGFGRRGWISKMPGDWQELYTVRRKWLEAPHGSAHSSVRRLLSQKYG